MSNESGLAEIDYVIVATYLIGILTVGMYFARRVKTSTDFFLAGRKLPFWAIGMSIVATDIGATDFIAVAGGTYRYGLAQANFDWIGSMPALVVAAFLFVPFYWRSGVLTVPEFLGRRYNAAVQLFLAVCWGLITVGLVAITLHATAVLLRGVLGWDHLVSIWITTIIVGVYTVTGGLTAVVMTDVFQLVIMFIGGALLVTHALSEVGGFASMQEQIIASGPEYANHLTLYLPHETTTPFPWTGVLLGLGIVLSTSYYTGNQNIVQRFLGAKSEWDAKAGVLFAGALKFFIPLLVAIPGLAAIVLLPDLEHADDVIPALIQLLLPPGLKGLMFAGFLAAMMSSVDSSLTSATTLWTQDVFAKIRKWRGNPFTDDEKLRFSRYLTGLLLVAAALVAPEVERQFTNIYTAFQTMFALVQGPTLAILLLGVLWHRANQWGGLIGLISGVGLCLFLSTDTMSASFPSAEPFLFISWWSFIFALVVTVTVSLLTDPDPPNKFDELMKPEKTSKPVKK